MVTLTRQDVSDIMDAVSVASEELRHMATLTEDYDDTDRVDITQKANRLDDSVFPKLAALLNEVAGSEPGSDIVYIVES
jgi:hypothetical protein